MVGWHHRLNGHEFEQAPAVSDGQGSLACCSPWHCKELDMTEQLKKFLPVHHPYFIFLSPSHSSADPAQKYIAVSLGLHFLRKAPVPCKMWSVCGALVTQSCPTLCDPMDCSPPGSSVHGIL